MKNDSGSPRVVVTTTVTPDGAVETKTAVHDPAPATPRAIRVSRRFKESEDKQFVTQFRYIFHGLADEEIKRGATAPIDNDGCEVWKLHKALRDYYLADEEQKPEAAQKIDEILKKLYDNAQGPSRDYIPITHPEHKERLDALVGLFIEELVAPARPYEPPPRDEQRGSQPLGW